MLGPNEQNFGGTTVTDNSLVTNILFPGRGNRNRQKIQNEVTRDLQQRSLTEQSNTLMTMMQNAQYKSGGMTCSCGGKGCYKCGGKAYQNGGNSMDATKGGITNPKLSENAPIPAYSSGGPITVHGGGELIVDAKRTSMLEKLISKGDIENAGSLLASTMDYYKRRDGIKSVDSAKDGMYNTGEIDDKTYNRYRNVSVVNQESEPFSASGEWIMNRDYNVNSNKPKNISKSEYDDESVAQSRQKEFDKGSSIMDKYLNRSNKSLAPKYIDEIPYNVSEMEEEKEANEPEVESLIAKYKKSQEPFSISGEKLMGAFNDEAEHDEEEYTEPEAKKEESKDEDEYDYLKQEIENNSRRAGNVNKAVQGGNILSMLHNLAQKYQSPKPPRLTTFVPDTTDSEGQKAEAQNIIAQSIAGGRRQLREANRMDLMPATTAEELKSRGSLFQNIADREKQRKLENTRGLMDKANKDASILNEYEAMDRARRDQFAAQKAAAISSVGDKMAQTAGVGNKIKSDEVSDKLLLETLKAEGKTMADLQKWRLGKMTQGEVGTDTDIDLKPTKRMTLSEMIKLGLVEI